jgi:hypothetical protein
MKFRIASFVLLFVSLLTIATNHAAAQVKDSRPIIGRWDLTVQMDRVAPSWLEVKLSGLKTLVGYFVAEGGSARPIAEVKYDNGKVSFSIPTQWDMSNNPMVFEGMLQNDQLSGTITTPKGDKYPFTGERAPLLKRTSAPVWGAPIALFNGKDLTGWHMSGKEQQWMVEAGVLKSPKSGSNIITDASYNDFKLHIEFRYPAGSNSGVYLRGRYEVQVEDNYGLEPSSTLFGGIYGFLTPNEMVAKKPGEWQSYDITLIGRRVSVTANGKAIIVDQIIPGITGGALNSKEGEPGPIFLQGDHGPVEYRNIVITPAK